MQRRGFLGAISGLMCSALGLKAGSVQFLPEYTWTIPRKRIFRCNPKGEWREIAWEEIRVGDKVLAMSLWPDGHFESLEAWSITKVEGDLVYLDGEEQPLCMNLLPRRWGNPTMAPHSREFLMAQRQHQAFLNGVMPGLTFHKG